MQRVSLAFQDKMVQSLLQHGEARFVQLSLNPGQGLTRHKTPLALTVVVVSGKIVFTVDDEQVLLEGPSLLPVGAGVEHAVEAVEKSVVLLVLAPSEGAEDGPSPRGSRQIQHQNAYEHPELVKGITPELRPLVEDHVQLCKVLLNLGEHPDLDAIRHALQVVSAELCHHFTAEEDIVFPRMAVHVGGADVGPVARLIEEHAHIRRLHGEAEDLFNAFTEKQDEHLRALLWDKVEDLTVALLNHLGKEDSHLFPMASRLMSEDEKAAIAEELQYIRQRH
ncbi:hemerythrin domain-containing protein [Alicyclobacillus herbarius]|uniref:hemerythrin domain-containing protein n=1 Tax=Alicyclobacillus herbarius TaxID=122960 RepID=UPI0003FD56EE|nr:hemerythrin domain-containing protein [Alicyclobacillus herbarius]